MTVTRRLAKLIATVPLILAVSFQLWVLLFKTNSDLSVLENIIFFPIEALLLVGPFIWSLIILRGERNPLVSLTITLPAAAVYFFAYYIEFHAPYGGGGASMIYVSAWAVALAAAGVCFHLCGMFIESRVKVTHEI